MDGEKAHQLTINEIPKHAHSIKFGKNKFGAGNYDNNSILWNQSVTTTTTEAAGGDQAHNNLQPYIVQNFIIKAYNNARTLSIVENSLDSDSTKNAVSVHIVNKKIAELQAQITALQTQIDTKSLNINGAQTIWYEDETNT